MAQARVVQEVVSMREHRRGFTLLELSIVVMVILIIAAIAIPSLLRSRISANEASSCVAVRQISTGEVSFQICAFVDDDGDGVGDYGTLAQLGDPDGSGNTPPFIDSVLATGLRHGYNYTVNVTLGAPNVAHAYTCTAIPSSQGYTGQKRYFVNESGVIRFTADGSEPTVASSPLQ